MRTLLAPETMDKMRRFLGSQSLTIRDFHILDDICSAAMPRQFLVERGARLARDFPELQPFSEHDAATTIDSLTQKGIVEEVNSSALARIEQVLAEDKDVVGPTEGLPCIGTLDFTPLGAECWLRMEREVFDWTEDNSCVGGMMFVDMRHIQLFGTDWPTATDNLFSVCSTLGWIRITGGEAIGPWRERWWRRLSHGWRIDVETVPGKEIQTSRKSRGLQEK